VFLLILGSLLFIGGLGMLSCWLANLNILIRSGGYELLPSVDDSSLPNKVSDSESSTLASNTNDPSSTAPLPNPPVPQT
jgi:hypothetical protein